MDLRLRRAVGMLKLGRAADAAEAAAEAGQEAGQPPLSAVSIAARVAAAGAKSLCEGEAEEEALDELTALKVCARCVSTWVQVHPFFLLLSLSAPASVRRYIQYSKSNLL